ncbi:unnamed protein product, partial [Brenthis ino]
MNCHPSPVNNRFARKRQKDLDNWKVNIAKRKSKRRRLAEFPDVEECLQTWFKQCRGKNISVSRPILREKAEEFSKSLGHSSFRASNGWLVNFKKRHELVFRKVCGESASVNNEICDEWIIQLQSLLKDYELKDVFNADEIGLFFKCLPDKTLIFKNEKCHGGKHSKERLTILLATNMTGSEKLKPLVIGKAKKPRCFSGCKSLPLDYDANKKAWMTADIFKGWLIKVDKKMIKEKRKILLFINNCTAHHLIPPLKAVKVKFFPPNTTSKLQPLDQGMNNKEASEEPLEPDVSVEADWNKLQNIEVQFEDYVTCDEGLATTGTLTDAEIIDTVNQNMDKNNEARQTRIAANKARDRIKICF